MNNREIKFRAWDTVWRKWITDYVIDPFGFVMCTSNTNTYYDGLHETKVILIQFTGLKDINSKEIYEGDIVRTGNSESAPLSLIVFKHQAFLLKYLPIEKKGSEQMYDYMENYEYFKIIGNIYENPELL